MALARSMDGSSERRGPPNNREKRKKRPDTGVKNEAFWAKQQKLEEKARTKMHEADAAIIEAKRREILENHIFDASELTTESQLPQPTLKKKELGLIAAAVAAVGGWVGLHKNEQPTMLPPELPKHVLNMNDTDNSDRTRADNESLMTEQALTAMNQVQEKEETVQSNLEVSPEQAEVTQKLHKVLPGESLWKILKKEFPAKNIIGIEKEAFKKYWTAENRKIKLLDNNTQALLLRDDGSIEIQITAASGETRVATKIPEHSIPINKSEKSATHEAPVSLPGTTAEDNTKTPISGNGKDFSIKVYPEVERGVDFGAEAIRDTEQTPVILKMIDEISTRAEGRGIDIEKIAEKLANNEITPEEAGQWRSKIQDVINYGNNKAKKELGILTNTGWLNEYKTRVGQKPIGQLYKRLGNFVDASIVRGNDVAEM